jgi:hypothetical protein
LERILAKALAADRTKRYQTAAAFGRDLNAIMFSLGRAVSSFDISRFVIDAMAQRAQKRAQGTDKRSLIGNLIEDAMMEFNSLDAESSGSNAKVVGGGSRAGSAPVKLGSFEDVQDWTKDIGSDGDPPDSRPAFKTKEYAAGNLAALEDEALSGRPSMPAPTPHPAPVAPVVDEEEAEPTSDRGASGGGSKATVIAIVIIALALGLLAAAYFSGYLQRR